VLKQNNLMLRSEHRERLEAWATGGSLIPDGQHWRRCGMTWRWRGNRGYGIWRRFESGFRDDPP